MNEAHDHHRVSADGKKIGALSAQLADGECAALARDGEDDERCKSCAFRSGTVPNGCLQTQLDVMKAVAEDIPFMCHQHLDHRGRPSKVCHGWFAARRVVDRIEAATGHKMPPAPYDFSPPDEPEDVNEDLQAAIPSDPHCRRRAFQLIALLYVAAGLANLWWYLR